MIPQKMLAEREWKCSQICLHRNGDYSNQPISHRRHHP
jgi:hypothetical protein